MSEKPADRVGPEDPAFPEMITAYDEALVAGQPLPDHQRLSPELQGRLARIAGVLRLLHHAGRARGQDGSVSLSGEKTSLVAGLGKLEPFVPICDTIVLGAANQANATNREVTSELPSVPGYRLLEEVGRGGMGVVYRAEHLPLNRCVALKMVLNADMATSEHLLRFQQEAELAARVSHPNVVAVHEIGRVQNRPFLALEWVPGGSLAQKLRSTQLSARESAQLVMVLARAVEAAHRQGVIHRDLKPANVMLTADGDPKITDFGLAKPVGTARGVTVSGAIVGTPEYMSPEQAAGSKIIGPACDIHALGVILYELLTGQTPFHCDNVYRTLERIVTQEPQSPRLLHPRTPADLETICLKCLRKDPDNRYTSAAALADDLRRFLDGEPIAARPVRALERLTKWAKRPALATAYGLALLVVVLGVLAGWLWWNRREPNQGITNDQAKTNQDNSEVSHTQKPAPEEQIRYLKHVSDALVEQRAGRSAKANELLDVCPPELHGWEWHFVRRLSHVCTRTLVGHGGAVHHLASSHDGKRILSVGSDQTLRIWSANNGQLLHTLEDAAGFHTVAWSNDDKLIFWANGQKEIKTWHIGQNKPKSTPELGGVMIAAAPTGERFAAFYGDETVKLCEPNGNEQAAIPLTGLFSVEPPRLAWDQKGERIVGVSNPRNAIKSANLWVTGMQADVRTPWILAFHSARLRGSLGSLGGEPKEERILVWDAKTGKQLHALPGSAADVTGVAISPGGRIVVSRVSNGMLGIFDTQVDRGVFLNEKIAQKGLAPAVAFSHDGEFMAVGGEDGTIKVFSARSWSWRVVFSCEAHQGKVNTVAFSPDGRHLISGGEDNTMKMWDYLAAAERVYFCGKEVHSVTFSPKSGCFAVGTSDEVKVIGMRAGNDLLSYGGLKGRVSSLAFSQDKDGSRLVAGSAQAGAPGTVKMWDAGGKVLLDFELPKTEINSVALSGDGKQVAAGASNGLVLLLDVPSGKVQHTLRGSRLAVQSVAYELDGSRLLSGYLTGTVKVWDTDSGKELSTFNGNKTTCLAFRHDGKRFVTAGNDGTLRVCDTESGEELLRLKEYLATVRCATFSRDGKRIAAGGDDNTVIVWDAETGLLAMTLEGHAKAVTGVAFSPDGHCLVSGSLDGTVRVWDATPRSETKSD